MPVFYSDLFSKAPKHQLVKKEEMFSCKELCQGLVCFVIGGIITVMFIKILEWQRSQTPNEEQCERRIMVSIQEVGDGETQEKRIEQENTVKIAKIPREQDEL